MDRQGATFVLSSSLILLLLYVQQAVQEGRVGINIMKGERGDPSIWKEVYERGKQIAAESDIESCMPN